MSLVSTFRVGRLTCHLLDGGSQRLDGGAMFGVVPRPLWERKIAPDERNRIPLALRCMLIEHDVGPILVDSGVGNKESEKFRHIYAVDNAGTMGPTRLEDAIAEAGFTVGEIRYVVNTHLHFDHAGGNTYFQPEERREGKSSQQAAAPRARPSFPNATYVVQAGELDFASHPNERTAGSYFAANFEPITKAGAWQLVGGERELVPGVRLLPTPGHVPFHQSVVVESGGEAACFLADLVPTTAHVPLPWIMGYDVEPLVTLETKRALFARAEAHGWLMVFEHDPVAAVGRVVRDGKGFAFSQLDTSLGRK